ncbi:MAG: tRNA (adenosine(37)-N6)-threonylcarbamoyltransferase complex ATPase subunit type 1 TsaE [bacterium]|nr:tRNA (adenosine(37)-N6)-threonylcarbamoyltransferase complex ATPase subunit type 1 TsaE [bacterium]
MNDAPLIALERVSESPDETRRHGQRLGALLRGGDVIALSGDLGAGKTTFTGGIGVGWGALDPVTSPTFTLVHPHRRAADSLRLYHIDAYRLDSADQVAALGWDAIFDGSGAVVVEWAERVLDALPADHVWIELALLDDQRRTITLQAYGTRARALLEAFDGRKSDAVSD